MKLLTYTTTKIRVISSSCLLIALSGCGSSFSDVASSAGGQILGNIRPQAVVISRISTIPTNLGVSGSHTIKVDNHTGKNLTLKSFELSGSATGNIFTRGYSALKSAVGAIGNDSRINVVACGSLFADSSCAITFSPNEADGSAALRLNFVDDSGNLYPAAQLLEYSSAVNKQNGFYVSNAQIADVPSTNSYSIAIPFVSDDEYESIVIDSRIITLSKSVDCANGANIGDHCTALLTLPAADPTSGGYSNTIKIKGTKVDGSVKYASLTSGTSYNDIANLAITSGPVIIKAESSIKGRQHTLTKTINIVNNGVNVATNVSGLSVVADKWLAGVTTSGGDSFLDKTISCTGGGSLPKLPISLQVAETCEVKFTLNNPEATGSEDYEVTYSGGVGGTNLTKTSTKIYYMGLEIPDYKYTLTGNTDFIGVKVKTSVSSSFFVNNVGSQALKNISYNGTPFPQGMSVDIGASSCSDYSNGKELMSGESCTYSLKYEPTSKAAESLFTFTVKAETTANPSKPLSQSRSIKYSATDNSGNGFVIVNYIKGLLIFNNGFDKRKDQISIQNTGSTDFTLDKITAKGWSKYLSLEGPKKSNTNPLEGIKSTNGEYTDSKKVIPAGAVADLIYTYGPTTELESGVAQQNFVGRFGNDSNEYSLVNITNYKAISNGVIVTSESVIPGISGGVTGKDNEFFLTKANQIKVQFKYAAGTQDKKGFLVNDSNLPFGFMVNKTATICPTASKGDTPRIFKANESCLVSYTFLASELNHSLFYTAATSGGAISINAPSYSINDGTGVHVVTSTGAAETTLTPKPFVRVGAKPTKGKDNNVYTITFTASDHAPYKLLSSSASANGQVIVTLIFNDDQKVIPRNNRSCTITQPLNNDATATCSIEVTKIATSSDDVSIPFNYSSTIDGDFNSVNSSVTLTK